MRLSYTRHIRNLAVNLKALATSQTRAWKMSAFSWRLLQLVAAGPTRNAVSKMDRRCNYGVIPNRGSPEKESGEDRQVPPPRHRSDRNRRRDLAYAAALTLACVGTDEMVFRICEAIW